MIPWFQAFVFKCNLYRYTPEKEQSDWYVEKRLLEGKVEKLDAEVAERDRLDAQIEVCVANLFERMRLLEKTNGALTEKLGGLVGAVQVEFSCIPIACKRLVSTLGAYKVCVRVR